MKSRAEVCSIVWISLRVRSIRYTSVAMITRFSDVASGQGLLTRLDFGIRGVCLTPPRLYIDRTLIANREIQAALGRSNIVATSVAPSI